MRSFPLWSKSLVSSLCSLVHVRKMIDLIGRCGNGRRNTDGEWRLRNLNGRRMMVNDSVGILRFVLCGVVVVVLAIAAFCFGRVLTIVI